ncbi:hypothetical protein LPJ81_001250 [Coemansia sp. IMI 209127]|nr:hypothetical protein LPJ81_001250 [Coemansia sp. IMI 209127]
MKAEDNDWEDYLFSPPPWPYKEGDPDVPKTCQTNQAYGYEIRQLDSLPVQAGHENANVGLNSENMDRDQAKQYYAQFEVFREIMLDKSWSAANAADNKENTSGKRQDASSSDRNAELDTAHFQDAARLKEELNHYQRRRSSTDSTMTAVSSDTDTETDIDGEESDGYEPGSHIFQTAIGSPFRAAKSSIDNISFGRTFALLRVPLLWLILAIISVELALYFSMRNLVGLYEYCAIWRGPRGLIFANMCRAESYEEYMDYARRLDANLGFDLEQGDAHSRFYDPRLLERVTYALRRTRTRIERLKTRKNIASGVRARKAYETMVDLCDLLRQGPLKANAGGWENHQIWSRAYSGTTRVIEEYAEEAVRSVNCVRGSRILPAQEKLAFFRQVAKQQGRTALCLSGGAAMGWKHLGVARCLLDEARLPRVISGTSAGSIVAAMLATHTDDELRIVIRPEIVKYMTACQGPTSLKLLRWLVNGYYFDAVEWVPRAQVFTRGNLTFLEAFQRTGKLLSITCTPLGHKYSPPKILNLRVMQPMVLLMKARDGRVKPYTDSGALWRDGSFRNDIPISDLRASFNVKFTIVSQVNPHIALFFYDRNGSVGQPPPCHYSSIWRGGFILSAVEHALKLDVRKWLRLLSDLNLVPLLFNQDWTHVWLQKFDGNITIVPPRRLAEYFRLLLDPTPQSLTQSMEAGRAATWPKVKMIKTRQKIEDAISAGWVDAYHACIKEGHLVTGVAGTGGSAGALLASESDESPPCPGASDDSSFMDETRLRFPRAKYNPMVSGCLPHPAPVRRRSSISSSTLVWSRRGRRRTASVPGLASVGLRTRKKLAQLAMPHGGFV